MFKIYTAAEVVMNGWQAAFVEDEIKQQVTMAIEATLAVSDTTGTGHA